MKPRPKSEGFDFEMRIVRINTVLSNTTLLYDSSTVLKILVELVNTTTPLLVVVLIDSTMIVVENIVLNSPPNSCAPFLIAVVDY